MTQIYKNGTLHCIIDDAEKADEAYKLLMKCFPSEKWEKKNVGKMKNFLKKLQGKRVSLRIPRL